MEESLIEEIQNPISRGEVNEEDRTIIGCKLMNNRSDNTGKGRYPKGRHYTDAARQSIREMYVNKTVAIAHGNQKWTDQVAVITETYVDPQNPNSDLCNLKVRKTKHGDALLYDAMHESLQANSCLSVEIPKGRHKSKITKGLLEIQEVHKVDPCALVLNGGTTFTLTESLNEDVPDEETMEIKTIAELESQFPELVTQIRDAEEAKSQEAKGKLMLDVQKEKGISAKVQAELDEANEKLAAIEAEKNREARKEETSCMCKEKELAVTEGMIEMLTDFDDETRGKFIEEMEQNKQQLNEEQLEEGKEDRPKFKPTGAKSEASKAPRKSISEIIAEAK